MTAKRTPADVLRESRRQDSLTKRTRVLAVVDDMKAKGEPVTFLEVARKAGVSNWLVYSEGLREHIEAARKGQLGHAAREAKSGRTVSDASLRTDLELVRDQLKQVREERDRLKAAVQRGLGEQVGSAGTVELTARVKELTDKLLRREQDLSAAQSEIRRLEEDLSSAQDSVASLRSALRQMMKDQSA